MNTIDELIQGISLARNLYINQVEDFTQEQALWKPDPYMWNVVEITEHLFWAEHGGIWGIVMMKSEPFPFAFRFQVAAMSFNNIITQ